MAITRLNSLAIPAGTVETADLSYPLTNFSSTGIDDNATSTAITIDASENVVLGNTSTSFDFEIYRSGAASQLAITGGNANVSDVLMGDTDDNNIQRIRSDHSDNSLQFQVNNAERMRIDSSGNLGLGTTAPSSYGGGFVVDDLGINILTASSGSPGTNKLSWWSDSNGISQNAYISVVNDGATTNTGEMVFYTRNASNVLAERMRIASSGNVGIGTSSPNARLNVQGAYGAQLTLQDNATNSTAKGGTLTGAHYTNTEEPVLIAASYNDATDNIVYVGGGWSAANAATIISFRTAANNTTTSGTERMRIDSSGNVGIGTSSPDAVVTLNPPNYTSSVSDGMIKWKNTNNSGHSNIQSYFVSGEGTDINIGANAYINTSGAWARWASGLATSAISCARSGNINFLNNGSGGAAVTRMTIESSGKIGIGTTNPDQTLHVHKGSAGTASSQANSVLTLENNASAILQFLTPNTADQQIRFGDPQDNGAGYINYSHAASALTFGVNGPERVRIDSSGHVGIGTTSPYDNAWGASSKQLAISGTNYAVLHLIGTSTTTRYSMGAGDNRFYMAYDDVNSVHRLTISSSGVGLGGNTSPVYELSQHTQDSGANYHQFTNTSTGTTSTSGFLVGIGGDEEATLWNYSNTHMRFATNSTERMRIDSNGNVGIGTSSPGNQLHVVGGIRFSSTGVDANRWNVYWNGNTGDLIVVSSDARLKKDFDYDIAGIETVNKLKPVRFTWKENNKRQLGFTAQESFEADEHLAWNDTENDQWGLDGWEGYAAVLTKAMQEQQVMIEELKAEVAALKGA